MGWPNTVITKSLSLISSTGLGSISTAAGGTVTLLSTITLDTARRITIACATLSGPNYTVTGLNATGNVIKETIIPSTTVVSIATTTQDFTRVTSIALSCAITNSSGGMIIGTSSQGGTPWVPIDTTRTPPYVGFQVTPTSSQTQTSFEYSQDYPSYNPVTGLWDNCATPTRGPQPTISSMCSSVIGPNITTQGYINFPITSWRITLSSCSSAFGSVGASVIQSGV